MTNTYILTGSNLQGHIEIEYCKGYLTAVKILLKENFNGQQFEKFFSNLPRHEEEISVYNSLGLKITKPVAANEKIALFCRIYEKYKGIKYKVSAADTGKVKLVGLDEETLQHYFTSQNFLFKGKHSISNLVKYYNELRAEVASQNKPKHPDYYDKAYEAKLKSYQLPSYYKHLRDLGLQVQRDRLGNVIDWVSSN